MGINPSDLQVMMPKTVEVARQYSQEAHKSIANQQNIAKQEEKNQEENTKKVHNRNETEKIYIKEEEKKEKEKDKENNRENRKDEEHAKVTENVKERETKPTGHFDVTV